jgi:hypothetical protein
MTLYSLPMLSTAACETAGQHGVTAELKRSEPASLAEVHALHADHVVEASQVVGFLSGNGAGIRIHGAWIRGDLNLDGMECAAGLRLTGCRLDQNLGGGPGAPALDLGRARVGGLLLSTGFAATLNVDGLTCSDTPVLCSGDPPTRVPEARRCT